MSARDALAELIERRVGIRLDAVSSDGVARLLSTRARTLGLSGPARYVASLESRDVGDDEIVLLLSALTNPHTYFFREPEQLLGVAEALAARSSAGGRKVAVWSAGCATGEEAFSVAMVLARHGIDAEVLGTDVNAAALEVAEAARYGPWQLRHLPPEYTARYLAESKGSFVVTDELRSRVSFKHHNLVDRPFPRPPATSAGAWDCILCRNVFIYFSETAVAATATAFAEALSAAGWLILSSTESLPGDKVPLRLARLGDSVAYVRSPRAAEDRGPAAAPGGDGGAAARPPCSPWPRRLEADRPRRTPAPLPSGPGAYEQSIERIDAGDLQGALEALEAYLAREPGDAVARVTKGNVHLRLLQLDRALASYGEARDANPLFPEVHLLEGVALRKAGDHVGAEQALRRALFLEPRLWQAALLLAGIYRRRGLAAKRVSALRRALEALGEDDVQLESHVTGMRDLDVGRDEAVRLCMEQCADDDQVGRR